MSHRPELWQRSGSLNGTLVIKPKPDVSLVQIQAYLDKHGARIGQPVGTLAHRLHLNEADSEALALELFVCGLVEYAEPDLEVYPSLVPNDPLLSGQFPASTNIETAWDLTTGSSSYPVAILDSGCDTSHEDMQVNVLSGWNVLSSNTDVTDNAGHGTQVSSIIAATPNNSKGMAGLGWSTKIVPIKITDSGTASTANIAAGLDWVRLNTNCRMASTSYAPNGGWGFSDSTLNTAINNCWTSNIITFFAAGDAGSEVTAPTGNTSALVIGGVNAFHSLNASNYGTGINFYSLAPSWVAEAFAQAGNETTYVSGVGTSVSSPAAAAIASLCLAVNPGLSSQQIVNILSNPLNGFTVHSLPSGSGWSLDARKCVMNATNLLPVLTPCGRS